METNGGPRARLHSERFLPWMMKDQVTGHGGNFESNKGKWEKIANKM